MRLNPVLAKTEVNLPAIHYPPIVERAGKGYNVFFLDLPGCTSAGRTIQEAAEIAEEALGGHLLVSEENGDAIADPSELDRIERDPDVEEVARLLVRGERLWNEIQRVTGVTQASDLEQI